MVRSGRVTVIIQGFVDVFIMRHLSARPPFVKLPYKFAANSFYAIDLRAFTDIDKP